MNTTISINSVKRLTHVVETTLVETTHALSLPAKKTRSWLLSVGMMPQPKR